MRSALFVRFTCALFALATVGSVSRADQGVPFKGTVVATVTSADPVPDTTLLQIHGTLDGNGTQLGKIGGWFDYFLDLSNGQFVGTIVKVGSNGDATHEPFYGYFTKPDLSASVGWYEIGGGTGRFQNAEGSGSYTGKFSSLTTGFIDYTGTIYLH